MTNIRAKCVSTYLVPTNRTVQHSDGRRTDRIIRRWRPSMERPLVQQYPCMESWACKRRCPYGSGCSRSSSGSVCYSGFHSGRCKRRPAVLRIKMIRIKRLPMKPFLSGVFFMTVPCSNRTPNWSEFTSEPTQIQQRAEKDWAARRKKSSSELKEIGQRDKKSPMKVRQKSDQFENPVVFRLFFVRKWTKLQIED